MVGLHTATRAHLRRAFSQSADQSMVQAQDIFSPHRRHPHISETWWWQYPAVGMVGKLVQYEVAVLTMGMFLSKTVCVSDLILGGRSTFQQHRYPQLTAKTTLHGSSAGMTHQRAQSCLESLARLEDFCKPVEAHTILCVFC